MKKHLFIVQLSLCFYIFNHINTFAQSSFAVQIEIPKQIAFDDIQFCYDNGKKELTCLKPVIKDNKLEISGKYYSKYATILVHFPSDNRTHYYHSFWITDKPAKIKFFTKQTDSTSIDYELTNVVDVWKMGEKLMKDFIRVEEKVFVDFLSKNGNNWTTNDSLVRKFMVLNQKLLNKKLDFIQKNGNLYYSLFLFRREVLFTDLSADTLKYIFNKSFKRNLKQTYEGIYIQNFLNGRMLSVGKQAPFFKVLDINGRRVLLDSLGNKFTLLVFWASWCKPCIQEIPEIKKIREQYSKDKLEIIFVSLDIDSSKFDAATKKYDMQWTHIWGNEELPNLYGITSIPIMYLINKSGKIVYARDQEKEGKLDVLNSVLADVK